MENGKLETLGSSLATAQELTALEGTTGVNPVVTGRPLLNEAAPVASSPRLTVAPADMAPLSFGQRRIWFLDQLDPGSALHHLAHLIRLRGRLDTEALESSLASLIERHDALRTTFVRHGADPVQIVSRQWTFHLALTDLSGCEASARESELAQVARNEATKSFDLRSDLLLRARLVRLGENDHALVLVTHQIAADSASMAVLYRELGELYAAFSVGGISLLPDLPLDYAEYGGRQREYLHGETLQRLVKFWKEYLTDAPPLLQLPSDHQRPPAQSRRGAVCTAEFPPELLHQLHAFSERHAVSLLETLLAAFKTLLHRYTSVEDIVVGTPLAGRGDDTAGLVGHFVNTLVLRSRFTGDPTFSDLLTGVRATLRAACDHQEIPFEKLVDELQPKRDLSYDALWQVGFSLQEAPDAHLKIAGLDVAVEPIHTGTAKTDLMVSAVETPSGLRIFAEYSRDLFEAGTVERLLGHFRTLLEAVVDNPDRPVSRLPLLTQPEHTRMLVDWNATHENYPRDKCIQHLFDEQVARTPSATALVFNDRELTYAELNLRAERLADKLRARGAGPDTLIALCAERSLEMVVGLLGIFKSGAAYVPLDPSFPPERLAFMLEDSAAPLIVTQRPLQSLFQGKAEMVFLDDDAVDDQPAERTVRNAPPVAANSENLAYILYTSGSTGRPKGVMIRHRNVVNFFAGMDRVVGGEPGVWLAVTSISFDISVLELFWTLTRGFKVIILADQAGMRSLKNYAGSSWAPAEVTRSLDEQLKRHPVTHFQCTPSFARLLTRMPATLEALRPLRRMLVGGEGLPADLAEVLRDAIEGQLVNMYGPTETTVWSTTYPVRDVRSGTVDIGRPIANTEIYILDRNRQPLPAGIPGELYIGGDGLARGYWHRPELTADRFVEHPFSSGEKLYRTGDLARYRADGIIEFIGRADHQVKVRGHRIELGEIEAALAQHPGILQSVVVVRTENPEDPRLAAYLVAGPSGAPATAELRGFLREKMPEHMVPDFYIFMERFPLTPNGKIDRNALPVPARQIAIPAGESPSLPSLEQGIAVIWKDILKVEHLAPDDNFFDSGGRSIQVVQVKSRLEESLGIELPIIKLFQYPTIRSLAEFISAQPKEAEAFHDKIKQRAERRRGALAGRRQLTAEVKS